MTMRPIWGEQNEVAREMQELRAVQHWVNPVGWDARAEGRVDSPSTGGVIDLRLNWADVKRRASAMRTRPTTRTWMKHPCSASSTWPRSIPRSEHLWSAFLRGRRSSSSGTGATAS